MIAQASPAAGPLRADPSKRVNYTLGLVLGVDEFQQDQLYHAAGRRGHNRLLHGYGTVWGLRVAAAAEAGDPEIQVDPGIAIDPCGREICVPDRMCVKLTRWVDRHKDVLRAFYGLSEGEAPPPLPLAVVLCHRECPTDTVPVPGEPCRTQEDAMAPSRISDSFELKLALRDDAPWGSPPTAAPSGLTTFRLSQPEEQAVRAFGLLLARVQSTTDEALGADGEATLLAALYALREAADEGTLASPPAADDDPILLPAGQAPDILRRALRLWVTEVRPAIRALEEPAGCGGGADGECCVLLAELDLHVTGGWAVAVNQPPLREDLRPYLLHTRLLQEWLIAQGGEEGRPDVDTWATLQILGPSQIRAWVHHAEWVNVRDALTVLVNEQPLPPAAVQVRWAGIRNVWDVVIDRVMSDGNVVEVRFDTEQVQLVAPPPADAAGWSPETGELQSPPRTVADELRGPSGEYVDRYGWTLSAFTVYDKLEGGDLRGEYSLPIVARIQTYAVSDEKPVTHDVLHFRDDQWFPDQLDQWSMDLRDAYPATRVTGIQKHPVSPTVPVDQNYLVYTDPEGAAPGQWEPRPLPRGTGDVSGTYPELTVTGLHGSPVAGGVPANGTFLRYNRPGEGRGTWDVITFAPQGGDVTGTYPVLEVTRLRGTPLPDVEPTEGQVLALENGEWRPSEAVGLLPPAGGDLSGTYPQPLVVGLRDRPLADAVPGEGNVLVFREDGSPPGGEWVPEAIAFSGDSDLGGTYPQIQITRLQGQPVNAAEPAPGQVLRYEASASSPPGEGRWVPADLPPAGATGDAGGDLGGAYPDPRVVGLRGVPLASADPAPGQVLRYEASTSSPPGPGRWVPADLPAGGVSGDAGGDLGGEYPQPRVVGIRGIPVAADPAPGQVLRFQPSTSSPPGPGRWVPVDLPAGGTTGPAGGDLTGTYPNPRIAALQGFAVVAGQPADGQVLRFRESSPPGKGQWVAVDPPAGGATEYGVVAAGVFQLRDIPGDANPVAAPYGGLALAPQKGGVWFLTGYKFEHDKFVYVVKALAQDTEVQLVREGTQLGIRLPRLADSDIWAEVHVEVSAYPRLASPSIREPITDIGTLRPLGGTTDSTRTRTTRTTRTPRRPPTG